MPKGYPAIMVGVRSVFGKGGTLLAMIIDREARQSGTHFLTPGDLQQQVAVMDRRAGEIIAAHSHLPVQRSVRGTQEVLIIESGLLRVDLFDVDRAHVASENLRQGQIIVLVEGGHGFEVIEDCKFIEVKQGPYSPGRDKVLFATGENL